MAPRSLPVAYALLVSTGWCGGHRFYLRHVGWGFLYAISLGGLGVGILVDLFLLPGLVDAANRGPAVGEGGLPRARVGGVLTLALLLLGACRDKPAAPRVEREGKTVELPQQGLDKAKRQLIDTATRVRDEKRPSSK